MGVGAGLYMCDVVVKSSRSLSHLLMSSCLLNESVYGARAVSTACTRPLYMYTYGDVCMVDIDIAIYRRPFGRTFRPILSDRCLSVCPVCNVGVLWPNGWMDQDETGHAGRRRPWPHCVR